MLTKLSYSVTFPTTGRTLAGEFDFEPGLGLITGANEQGKSLVIEVVRWCLFGSAALRGKAEDWRDRARAHPAGAAIQARRTAGGGWYSERRRARRAVQGGCGAGEVALVLRFLSSKKRVPMTPSAGLG
jgi:DNA repair exonuclease SbcCD ATPase subunit